MKVGVHIFFATDGENEKCSKLAEIESKLAKQNLRIFNTRMALKFNEKCFWTFITTCTLIVGIQNIWQKWTKIR